MDDSIEGPSIKLAALAVSVVVGAFFAAVDAAISAYGQHRARAASEGDGADAVTGGRLVAEEREIQARLLVGRVLSLVTAVALSYDIAWHMERTLPRIGLVALVTLTYAGAVGVAITLASRRANGITLKLVRLWRPFELVVALPAAPLMWASALVDRWYPPKPEHDPMCVTEEEVERMIEQGEEQGSIDMEHAELLKSVIEFGDTIAREIMVPRTSMVAIDINTPVAEVITLIVEKGHSRYPVYSESIDELDGILYAKDLFASLGTGQPMKLADLLRRPVFFAAETDKISDLLRQMQARRVHLAVVADEYGGTSGIVSLEDIIEEIVGEIRDEHDLDEAPIRRLSPGRYMVDGDVSAYDAAKATGLSLPDANAEYGSMGGLLTGLSGRMMKAGESLSLGDYDLIVRAADPRRIERIEVVCRSDLAGAAE